MKHSIIYVLLSVVLLFSCKKDDDKKIATITYKLKLKATAASTGITNFSEISYRKADGTIATLTNRTASFEETFDIPKNFNVFFKISGVNNGTANPDVTTLCEVIKYVDNVQNQATCSFSRISKTGGAGNWSFSTEYEFTFTETACR